MKKNIVFLGISVLLFLLLNLSFRSSQPIDIGQLRELYSGPKEKWPVPNVDEDIVFNELGPLVAPPLLKKRDSLKNIHALGRLLFFDPRLSTSEQISCSSCHAPDLNWTDGRRTSVGHNHSYHSRNTPSLENVWANKSYFWDGRANTIEEQSRQSISSPIEMHQDPEKLPGKIKKIKGYAPYFEAAYGKKSINTQNILHAIAIYVQTIQSRKSDFDFFLEGQKDRLTDEQVLGLHLFRTKARCINCHNGPFFTDNNFHNVGITLYGKENREDLGRYNITKNPEDVGKFKTPGLRNVIRSRPWFHNGIFDNIGGLINLYSMGMVQPKPTKAQENDPLFPKTSPHIKRLNLTLEERNAIIAFLNAITSAPLRDTPPQLPK